MPTNLRYLTGFIWACALVIVVAGAGRGEQCPEVDKPEQPPQILAAARGPIHLGDESFPDWSVLYGNSLELDIQVILPVRSLILTLQTYGLEINAPVYLNYHRVAVLPRQATIPGSYTRPNEWSPDRSIVLPADNLKHGVNRITITTDLVPRPAFSGDLDDFQIRSLRIISK